MFFPSSSLCRVLREIAEFGQEESQCQQLDIEQLRRQIAQLQEQIAFLSQQQQKQQQQQQEDARELELAKQAEKEAHQRSEEAEKARQGLEHKCQVRGRGEGEKGKERLERGATHSAVCLLLPSLTFHFFMFVPLCSLAFSFLFCFCFSSPFSSSLHCPQLAESALSTRNSEFSTLQSTAQSMEQKLMSLQADWSQEKKTLLKELEEQEQRWRCCQESAEKAEQAASTKIQAISAQYEAERDAQANKMIELETTLHEQLAELVVGHSLFDTPACWSAASCFFYSLSVFCFVCAIFILFHLLL